MSNSVAEAYLLIVRESNVPIIGEAVPVPFTGQIELDAWTWEIKNDERMTVQHRQDRLDNDARTKKKEAKEKKEKEKKEKAAAKSRTDARLRTPSIQPQALIAKVALLQNRRGMDQKKRDKEVKKLIKKALSSTRKLRRKRPRTRQDADYDEVIPKTRR